MKEDKLIKWLILAVVVAGLVLGGLYFYLRYSDKRNEDALQAIYSVDLQEEAGTPEINVGNISYKDVNSYKGIFRRVVGNILEMSLDEGEAVPAVKKWNLNDKTTATCTNDLFVDENGIVRRRSQMLINYKEGPYSPPPMSNDINWIKNSIVNGEVIQVFGEISTMTADVIFVYKDKCD